jgi:hypothetical protein
LSNKYESLYNQAQQYSHTSNNSIYANVRPPHTALTAPPSPSHHAGPPHHGLRQVAVAPVRHTRKVSLQTPVDPALIEKYRRSLNQYKKRNEKSLSMSTSVNNYHINNNNTKIELVTCVICKVSMIANGGGNTTANNYNVNMNRTCMLCAQIVCNSCSIVSVVNLNKLSGGDANSQHGTVTKSGLKFGLLCRPCSKRQEISDAQVKAASHYNGSSNGSSHHTSRGYPAIVSTAAASLNSTSYTSGNTG